MYVKISILQFYVLLKDYNIKCCSYLKVYFKGLISMKTAAFKIYEINKINPTVKQQNVYLKTHGMLGITHYKSLFKIKVLGQHKKKNVYHSVKHGLHYVYAQWSIALKCV